MEISLPFYMSCILRLAAVCLMEILNSPELQGRIVAAAALIEAIEVQIRAPWTALHNKSAAQQAN